MKKITVIFIYILIIVIIVPALITYIFKDKKKLYENKDNKDEQVEKVEVLSPELIENIIVEDTEKQSKFTLKLEEYIKGVVAAEMPVLFENEALKAQAVAARTYAIKHIKENEDIKAENIGQAYISIEEMKKRWGNNFENYYNKINNAVDSTKGQIMIFDNQPIEAVFHSTSRGITEEAQNVWGHSLPYIKSVNSSFDQKAPDFEYTTQMSKKEVIKKIKNKFNNININENNIIKNINILSKTEAGYVKEVSVFGNIMSGVEFRKLFSLRSADFQVSENANNIIFKTKGYGHGAGMSQYGAEFMAQDGKKYDEILKYYYFGIEIIKINM